MPNENDPYTRRMTKNYVPLIILWYPLIIRDPLAIEGASSIFLEHRVFVFHLKYFWEHDWAKNLL
jgi:hypothetical protein